MGGIQGATITFGRSSWVSTLILASVAFLLASVPSHALPGFATKGIYAHSSLVLAQGTTLKATQSNRTINRGLSNTKRLSIQPKQRSVIVTPNANRIRKTSSKGTATPSPRAVVGKTLGGGAQDAARINKLKDRTTTSGKTGIARKTGPSATDKRKQQLTKTKREPVNRKAKTGPSKTKVTKTPPNEPSRLATKHAHSHNDPAAKKDAANKASNAFSTSAGTTPNATAPGHADYVKNMITGAAHMDGGGKNIRYWDFESGWPIKWEGPSFDSGISPNYAPDGTGRAGGGIANSRGTVTLGRSTFDQNTATQGDVNAAVPMPAYQTYADRARFSEPASVLHRHVVTALLNTTSSGVDAPGNDHVVAWRIRDTLVDGPTFGLQYADSASGTNGIILDGWEGGEVLFDIRGGLGDESGAKETKAARFDSKPNSTSAKPTSLKIRLNSTAGTNPTDSATKDPTINPDKPQVLYNATTHARGSCAGGTSKCETDTGKGSYPGDYTGLDVSAAARSTSVQIGADGKPYVVSDRDRVPDPAPPIWNRKLSEPSTDSKPVHKAWLNILTANDFVLPDGGAKDGFVHISAVERAGMTSPTQTNDEAEDSITIDYGAIKIEYSEQYPSGGSGKEPSDQPRDGLPNVVDKDNFEAGSIPSGGLKAKTDGDTGKKDKAPYLTHTFEPVIISSYQTGGSTGTNPDLPEGDFTSIQIDANGKPSVVSGGDRVPKFADNNSPTQSWPGMRERGFGRIINISSINGQKPANPEATSAEGGPVPRDRIYFNYPYFEHPFGVSKSEGNPISVERPFLMPIEDVFSISGRGTVSKGRVERGQVLSKPGSVTPHTKFKAETYILTKEEGGRHTPFFTNYRPQFYMRTTDVTGLVTLPSGTMADIKSKPGMVNYHSAAELILYGIGPQAPADPGNSEQSRDKQKLQDAFLNHVRKHKVPAGKSLYDWQGFMEGASNSGNSSSHAERTYSTGHFALNVDSQAGERQVDQPFLMPVEDVFSISGKGTTTDTSGIPIRDGNDLAFVNFAPLLDTTEQTVSPSEFINRGQGEVKTFYPITVGGRRVIYFD